MVHTSYVPVRIVFSIFDLITVLGQLVLLAYHLRAFKCARDTTILFTQFEKGRESESMIIK